MGTLVSNTVPSSSVPVYQQLTFSPFFGKLVLSPFFNTDFVNFGGPWDKIMHKTEKHPYLNGRSALYLNESSALLIHTSSTTSVLTSLGLSSTFTALTCSVTSSTGSVPLNLCKTQSVYFKTWITNIFYVAMLWTLTLFSKS